MTVATAANWLQRRATRVWARRGSWAIADQALFSLSNLALNVLLARWLAPSGYGAFVTAFAVFLLLSGIHNALLIEPMSVFGAGRYSEEYASYMRKVTGLQWGLSSVLAVPTALVGLAYRLGWFGIVPSRDISGAFFAVSLATPFVLYFWTMRRACYARLNTGLAAAGSAVYLVLMVGGQYILWSRDMLSIPTCMGTMAFAGFVVGSVLLFRMSRPTRGASVFRVAALMREHWSYGRWAIATTVTSWMRGNIYYMVLPIIVGLGASGGLRASMTLVSPIASFSTAVGTFLVPTFVRLRASRSTHYPRVVWLVAVLFSIAGLAYWLAVLAYGRGLMRAAFGDAYSSYYGLLPIVGLIPVLSGTHQVLASALRAQERPDLEFRAQFISAGVALTAGVLLSVLAKTEGAAVGLLLTALVSLAMALRLALPVISTARSRGRTSA